MNGNITSAKSLLGDASYLCRNCFDYRAHPDANGFDHEAADDCMLHARGKLYDAHEMGLDDDMKGKASCASYLCDECRHEKPWIEKVFSELVFPVLPVHKARKAV